MINKELEILTNIIGGVESGGQIYGKRRYEAYAGKYANTQDEKTCTLGWAQNYGARARRLCQMIMKRDPKAFRAADTAGIEKKLSVDWEKTEWGPSAKEKAALIASITTAAGKTCQDELFEEQMAGYIKEAEKYGVTTVQAQMMWCEIQHLGGLAPVKRIFARAQKPYTPDTIYASLLLDQKDASNNNQVGDTVYQSRHQCCVSWIKKYAMAESEEKTMGVTAKQILDVMRSWLGLSRTKGTHKPIIDLYNSHYPLARGYKASYTDDYCDITVSAAFIKLDAVDLIGGTECGVEEHIKIFDRKGIWQEDGTITPKPGYIICYNWDTSVQPNDGYADHIGIVESVDTNARTMKVIEGNTNGGVVGRRIIPIGWGYIRGYAVPKYADSTAAKTENKSNAETRRTRYMFEVKTVQSGSTGNDVKLLQRLLKSNGCKGRDGKNLTIDGSCGDNTVYAIKEYQKKKKLKVDGSAGNDTWKSILIR